MQLSDGILGIVIQKISMKFWIIIQKITTKFWITNIKLYLCSVIDECIIIILRQI